MRVPILYETEHLVLGSGVLAMAQALRLAEQGAVLLVTEDTFLYSELVRTGDYRLPKVTDREMAGLLFPGKVRDREDALHPDRLKLHGEQLFEERDISLLYACQVLGAWEGYALLAHKAGLFAVKHNQVYDFRKAHQVKEPAYCLNVLEGDGQRALLFPVASAGNSPKEQIDRFLEAARRLDQAVEVGRGGTEATELAGLVFAIPEATTPPTGNYLYPAGERVPRFSNPLHEDLRPVDLPSLLADCQRYDVVVVGGGTSGAPAAIQSAKMGLKTLLIEMNRQLGGTGTVGGVNSYWFGTRSNATKAVDQAVDRNYKRLGQARIPGPWGESDHYMGDLKSNALLESCLDAGVSVCLLSTAFGVEMEQNVVQGVYYAKDGQAHLAQAGMVIDCTGDGDVCMFAGAAHSYGNLRDGMTFWASLAQYTSPNAYRNNFSTMVHVGDPLDYTRFIRASRKFGEGLFDHGQYVAVRESRHIKGLYTVTLEDILSFRPVPNTLYTCFSNYDPKGLSTSDFVYFGLLQPNQKIPIPLEAVIPVNEQGRALQGILAGGKAMSCTHDAMPAIRMQPDMQTQGFALAVLAAQAITEGIPAWEVQDIERKIVQAGGNAEPVPVASERSIAQSIAAIREDEPWEWLEMSHLDWAKEVSPLIRLMLADPKEAVPQLQQAYHQEQNKEVRLHLARLLLWHRDETGAGEVVDAVWDLLRGSQGLPARVGSIQHGQLLPDHGLMPEAVYLLNALGHTRETDILALLEEVLRRLETGRRDWLDLRQGIYCYCECFAYVAVKRRDPRLVPLLLRVLALRELNEDQDNGLMAERLQMLRLILLDALNRLGHSQGRQGLQAMLRHPKRILSQAAHRMLSTS